MTEALSRSLGRTAATLCGTPPPPRTRWTCWSGRASSGRKSPAPCRCCWWICAPPPCCWQNIPTTLKEPFSLRPRRALRDPRRPAADAAGPHRSLSGCPDPPLNAELIYHRLVQKIVDRNGVPRRSPRSPGCWPQEVRALRQDPPGQRHPKHGHQDPSHRQGVRPGPALLHHRELSRYAPLESQIRTLRSFRRPVILVDDLLHSGNPHQRSGPALPPGGRDRGPGAGGATVPAGAGT